MSKYKNNSKAKFDANGELLEAAKTIRFSILKQSYEVAPGEEIEVCEEHEVFLKSRGLALDPVKGNERAPSNEHVTDDGGHGKGGKPAAPPPFAGDVKGK